MKVASFSIGSKSYPNEDRMAIQNMGIYGIAIVLADGMGGLSLGDLAADVVTNTVADYLKKNYEGYAEKNLGVLSADEISRKLNDPEDDASLIEVSVQKQELLSS